MCGSDPTPPATPKTPVASDPNSQAIGTLTTMMSANPDNPSLRKSLNIDLSSGGQGGTGLSIPQ